MSGAARRQSRATLLPGIALPVIGYVCSLTVTVLALVAVTFPGPHNHSLHDRWPGGQVLVVGAWALYKLTSNRIRDCGRASLGRIRFWWLSRGRGPGEWSWASAGLVRQAVLSASWRWPLSSVSSPSHVGRPRCRRPGRRTRPRAVRCSSRTAFSAAARLTPRPVRPAGHHRSRLRLWHAPAAIGRDHVDRFNPGGHDVAASARLSDPRNGTSAG
jgi:hypothetical protein